MVSSRRHCSNRLTSFVCAENGERAAAKPSSARPEKSRGAPGVGIAAALGGNEYPARSNCPICTFWTTIYGKM